MKLLVLFCSACYAAGVREFTFSIGVHHLTTARADPIFSPGKASAHVHHVYGGNCFGLEQNYANAAASTCNTSPFREDNSNYWTNALYRVNPNGTYTLVPSKIARIYYVTRDDGRGVEAFPKDFRMVAKAQNDMSITCINAGSSWNVKTLDELLADQRECGTMQVRMGMPECYDGRVDSENHQDHVKKGGDWACPPTHPKRLPGIGFEFEYDYEKSIKEVPGARLIFADNTSTVHADFLNGWDIPKLQKLIDGCLQDGCSGDEVMRRLTKNPNNGECKIDGKTLVNEEIVHVKTLPAPGQESSPPLEVQGGGCPREVQGGQESSSFLMSGARAIGGRCFGAVLAALALCTW